MPTKQWVSKHQQVKFWLPKPIFREFSRACKEAGRSQSDVLRDVVKIMLPVKDAGDGSA